MKVIKTIREIQNKMIDHRSQAKTIGFVPTMGYLHEGHLQLLTQARSENDIVVLSIFVNPLQFGPKEDLSTYPRDFERDYETALKAGVDYLFYPSAEEMYPKPSSVKVIVQDRTDVLCGKSRPGHFDGVATVLAKLFNIILPTRAYFGMKDAQQVAVVEGLVKDFHFPIQIVQAETVREADGLAKSSRNVYLTEDERRHAPVLYQSLLYGKSLIENGETIPETVLSEIRKKINEGTSGIIDYLEMYHYPELTPVSQIDGRIIIALAVKFSKARLIDNIVFKINEPTVRD